MIKKDEQLQDMQILYPLDAHRVFMSKLHELWDARKPYQYLNGLDLKNVVSFDRIGEHGGLFMQQDTVLNRLRQRILPLSLPLPAFPTSSMGGGIRGPWGRAGGAGPHTKRGMKV